MSTYYGPLTPNLARAGRAIAEVSAGTIAEAAGLASERVRAFETRGTTLPAEEAVRLKSALEEFGVVFIDDDENGGYGVRRKYSSSKTRQLKRWEGEGGPAYEDDI